MKSKFLTHFFVWFLYQLIQNIFFYLAYPQASAQIFDNTYQFVLYIGIFYLLHYSVFKGYSIDKNIFAAFINYILCYVIILFAIHFSFSYLLPLLGNRDTYPINYKIGKALFSDVFMNYFQFSVYAFLYWQFTKRVNLEKKLSTEKIEKLNLTNAKLKTEYDYLQSQINPHFLYNTLDFFYAKMLKQDKPTAAGIATLSDLMRYSLNTGNADGKVALVDEVEQIENYITLQQLRFNNELHIQFKHNEIDDSIKILPHALITLVENAFKYGVTNDVNYPILIKLDAKPNRIYFSVSNQIAYQQMDKSHTGIGLQNLVKRLQLEYNDKQHYTVTHTENNYITVLIIDLL